MPRVSVGMPILNGAAYLREALDCWLAQDLLDFELVCSDNASTDATPDILAEYAQRDSRIRFYTRPETVPAPENFNGLVEHAKAPLFAWAAADDLREPSYLSKLAAALDAHPDAVLAYSYTHLFGDPVRERRRARSRATPGEEATRLGRLTALLRTKEWYLVYGLIRTDVLRKTRLFVWPMGFNHDCGLCLELATLGRFVCVREPLMHVRLHAGAASADADHPINRGRRGRRLDEAALRFAEGLELTPAERPLFMRQLALWCKKAEKPRRHLWRSPAFRRLWVGLQQARIDVERRLRGVG